MFKKRTIASKGTKGTQYRVSLAPTEVAVKGEAGSTGQRTQVGTRWNRAITSLLLIAACTWFVSAPTPALAIAQCNMTNHIFIRNIATIPSTAGTTNKIFTKNATLDSDCQSGRFSTAHMTKGTFDSMGRYTYVEIGWTKQKTSSGSVILCIFWEYQLDGVQQSPGSDCSTSLTYGDYADWRIDGSGTPSHYDLQVDYLNGGGWHTKHTYNTNFDTGLASGETEQIGTETAMTEDQRSLDFYDLFAGPARWVAWGDVSCAVDEAPNWDWHRQSSTSYTVDQNSHAC